MSAPMRKPLQDEVEQTAIRLVAQARVHYYIRAIGADAWNSCFPGELEDYRYLLALEGADIAGFAWRYVTVEENGRVLAAIPAFLTDYHLDTTLEDGALRRIIRNIRRIFPRFFTLKLACLGSPETECGLVGFHPSVAESRKGELLTQLLSAFEYYALSQGYKLIGIKDIPVRHKALWDEAAQDFTAMQGMASAYLDIDFSSMDDYLSRLSGETRKDMRRKLKTAGGIQIEQCACIDDVLPDIMQLYQETKARSELQFGELTEDYFRGILTQMKGKAFCTLYWHEQELLAANLILHDKRTLLDKFFVMGSAGRRYNLYFLSWFHNLQYCLDHGLSCYQSGQAGYDTKLRLKSDLQPSWMLFKHANPFLNRLLRMIAPLLAIDEEAV